MCHSDNHVCHQQFSRNLQIFRVRYNFLPGLPSTHHYSLSWIHTRTLVFFYRFAMSCRLIQMTNRIRCHELDMLLKTWSRHSVAKKSVFAIEILNASNDVIWHQKILMLNFYSTYESLSNFLHVCNWHELYYSPTFFRTPSSTDPLISS